jgi:hypothetical protein
MFSSAHSAPVGGPQAVAKLIHYPFMSTPEPSMQGEHSQLPTLAPLAPSVGRWLMRCAILVFAFVTLYFLSIGPAVQLNRRGLISLETFERLYSPLSFFSDIPGSQWLLDHYMRLWADPGPDHG